MAKNKEIIQKQIERLLEADLSQNDEIQAENNSKTDDLPNVAYDDNMHEEVTSQFDDIHKSVQNEYTDENASTEFIKHNDIGTILATINNTETQMTSVDTQNMTSTSDNQETTKTMEIEEENREIITINRKRKRVCYEPNASFFCSCDIQHDSRTKNTTEQNMIDKDRSYVDSFEIGYFCSKLSEKHRSKSYVMQVEFFNACLRNAVEINKGRSIDVLCVATGREQYTPMIGPFTDETDERARVLDGSYPSKDDFVRMEQVSQYLYI